MQSVAAVQVGKQYALMQRKPPLPPPQSPSKLHSGDLGAGSSMHDPLSQTWPVGHLPALQDSAQLRFTHF